MGKLTGAARLFIGAAADDVITVVADVTARNAIASPSDGDLAWVSGLGRMDKYVTSAWVDGNTDDEVGVVNTSYQENYDTIDLTDSTTAAGASETGVTRQEINISYEGIMRDGSGNKLTGANMSLVYNSITIPIRTLTYETSFSEIDITDSGTAAGQKEFAADRASRTTQFTGILRDDVAPLTNGAEQAATLTLASGITVAGNLRIESAEEGSAINEAKTYTYSGSWQGAPTETALSPAGHLNSARKALLVYADGKTTLGSFYLLNRSINGDVLADLRVSFDGKFTGAVTKTDAS